MATVFFLEINYYGDVFRFSTYPINLIDTVTGDNISFEGGLDEVDYQQQSKLVGYNLDQDSLSLELHFKGINWVAEWIGKRTLDGSNCVLFLGNSETTKINELERLAVGRVHDSIFGYPDKIIGWTSFSIENNQSSQGTIRVLPDYYKMSPEDFEELIPSFIGATAPFILGLPARSYWVSPVQSLLNQDRLSGAPAYVVRFVTALLAIHIFVAYGRIQASRVRIYNRNGWMDGLIQIAQDVNGRDYSYVDQQSPIASHNFFIDREDTGAVFWTEFNPLYGGGVLNPFGPGLLTGGGDICLYFLGLSNIDYDYSNWHSIRSLLNDYKFSGYINDPEVTIWEWLQESIISLLPIEIINIGRGISPVVNLLLDNNPIPSTYLIDNSDSRIITGLQPIDIDIVNSVRINTSWDGQVEKFKSSTIVNCDNSQIARNSVDLYGVQELEVDSPYVYDPITASKIAHDIIALQGLKRYAIELSTTDRYSYISVGDIISISSDRLGFDSVVGQIIGKSWQDPEWNYIIQLTTN